MEGAEFVSRTMLAKLACLPRMGYFEVIRA